MATKNINASAILFLEKNDANDFATTYGASTANVTNYDIAVLHAYYQPTDLWATTRVGVVFNTSVLGAGSKINSATLTMYVTAKTDSIGDGHIAVCDFNPASYTSLVAGDYNDFGSTYFSSSWAITSITTSANNSISINASGLANINVSSYTGFGLRNGYDILNSARGESTFNQQVNLTTTLTNYTLAVNYTPPPSGSPMFFGGGVTIS